MSAIPPAKRAAQMVLFGEALAVPQWSGLAETTRIEVVGLLAQLLVSVRTDDPAPQKRGGRDE